MSLSETSHESTERNRKGCARRTCSKKYHARVASKKELLESRERWNSLVRRMPYPSIFCSWEWVQTWWKHFAASNELFVIFIEKDSELVGILPLFVSHASGRKRDEMLGTVLRFCGSTHVNPDHLDIIAKESESVPVLSTAFEFLVKKPIKWDVLVLSGLSEEAMLIGFLKTVKLGIPVEIRDQSVAPYVRIRGTFDEYLKQFGKKKRYNIKRASKMLEKHTAATYGVSNRLSARWLDVMGELHARRADQKRLQSAFSTPRPLAFHRDLVRSIPSEWLFARFLSIGTTPIAGFYGFQFEGTLFFYQGGFDPKFEALEPGSVIISHALKESHDLQLREFNFLQGGEAYKFKWTKSYRRLFEARIYRQSFWGMVWRGASRAKGAISSAFRKSHVGST